MCAWAWPARRNWFCSPPHHVDATNAVDWPVLSQLSDEQRGVALDAALRVLAARGHADDEGGELAATGVVALLGRLRWHTDAAFALTVDEAGVGTHRAKIYRLRADLFTAEEIDAGGIHQMWLHSPERQAAWLAGGLDLHQHADRTEPPEQAATVEALSLGPAELAARAETTATVIGEERHPRWSLATEREPECH